MEALDIATKIIQDGFTFDDVLLVPAYSEISPADASTRTRLTREIDRS